MTKSHSKGKQPIRKAPASQLSATSKTAWKQSNATGANASLSDQAETMAEAAMPPPQVPLPEPPPKKSISVAAAHIELVRSAQKFYNSMQAPLAPSEPTVSSTKVAATMDGITADDEEYWASFPPHIRHFVRTVYSSPPVSSEHDISRLSLKAKAMYSIAQQMVKAGPGGKAPPGATLTTTTTIAAEHVLGACPTDANTPVLVDPNIFSSPAFNRAIEKAAAALAPFPMPGDLDSTMAALFEGADDYSEVEDHNELEGESEEESRVPLAADFTYSIETSSVSSSKTPKKSKKKRKNASQEENTEGSRSPGPNGVSSPVQSLDMEGQSELRSLPGSQSGAGEPEVAPEPRRDKSSPAPSSTPTMPVPRSQTTANPPPSSVSIGKKPMAYPPATAPAAQQQQQPQQQGKSARAASKAPLPAHAYPHNHAHHHPSPPSSNASQPHKPRPPAGGTANSQSSKGSKIWSTSSSEERERIKEFWLGLGEEERRNLVKIEKDTVLRKMKETQKHSCNCAVCGRKRNAIEEELEVLYDAYYEELETYANLQQRYVNSGGAITPPPGPGPFPGSVELDKNGAVVGHNAKPPPLRPTAKQTPAVNGRGKVQHPPPKPAESEFDDDDLDEEYDDEEEYEEEDEEDEDEDEEDEDPDAEEEVKPPRAARPGRGAAAARDAQPAPVNGAKPNGRENGLFNLGNSLTVTGPGNILTVADDLLKNDGQKFLEMMEQLAERRMQREDWATADVEEDSEEEDDDEGDEEDEEDDEEDDEDEDDEEEVMTEKEKMEEGKRMFSIFAARMFEQRVLQAYREKVAQERQNQLLRELADEDKLAKEREAKKQTQNQKKKDKKKQQKLAKEEERAAKAAEKAAEEASLRAKQAAQEEDSRKKREEERARREAQRKAQEEDRLRKEEDRRKRLAEEKDREAERERKRREREERVKAERREKEERERKAREEKEVKLAAEKAEKERARREREEREREERDKKLAREREEKAEREAKEKLAKEQQQQRATASSSKTPRAPPSPRTAITPGSSSGGQRTTNTNGITKKNVAKPPPVSTPSTGTSQQPAHPPRQTQPLPNRPPPAPAQASQPPTPITSHVPQHIPAPHPQAPIYVGGPPGMLPGAPGVLSPRLPQYPPTPFGYGPGPSMPPNPPSLAPSVLPRNFGVAGPPASPFDGAFPRGMHPIVTAPIPAPIGPPPKTPLPSTALAPGSNRRPSVVDGPGPIGRPIAPIARPTAGEPSGSGSGSPVRRSPSPKGVLGSSALAADDDEVVPPPSGRRVGSVGTVGQPWGQNPTSPRAAIGDNPLRSNQWVGGPGGPPGPPGFVSPRPPPIGSGHWNPSPNTDWHPAGGPFYGAPFGAHTSPPPHSGAS